MKVLCLDRGVVIILVTLPALAYVALHYDGTLCSRCVTCSCNFGSRPHPGCHSHFRFVL